MVWKSNIVNTYDKNCSIDDVSSPNLTNDKENEQLKNTSETIDARTSENYLANDDIVEV